MPRCRISVQTRYVLCIIKVAVIVSRVWVEVSRRQFIAPSTESTAVNGCWSISSRWDEAGGQTRRVTLGFIVQFGIDKIHNLTTLFRLESSKTAGWSYSEIQFISVYLSRGCWPTLITWSGSFWCNLLGDSNYVFFNLLKKCIGILERYLTHRHSHGCSYIRLPLVAHLRFYRY